MGNVDRIADRRVFHAGVGADDPDHDGAGVDPDAHVDRGVEEGGGVAGGFIPDLEGCEDRTPGVVLVGERSTEEGEHPVAEKLVDGAFVSVDGCHPPGEEVVEELDHLFGIDPAGEVGRADQVGEEDRDDLAFALDLAAPGHHLLGEVAREKRSWSGRHALNGRWVVANPGLLTHKKGGLQPTVRPLCPPLDHGGPNPGFLTGPSGRNSKTAAISITVGAG